MIWKILLFMNHSIAFFSITEEPMLWFFYTTDKLNLSSPCGLFSDNPSIETRGKCWRRHIAAVIRRGTNGALKLVGILRFVSRLFFQFSRGEWEWGEHFLGWGRCHRNNNHQMNAEGNNEFPTELLPCGGRRVSSRITARWGACSS